MLNIKSLRPLFLYILRGTIVLLLALSVHYIHVSFADDQGYIGDALSTELKLRSLNTGEKFIFTRKAFIKERQVGPRALLESQSKKVTIRGWTLIYLPDENISEIQRRAELNQRAWKPSLIRHSITISPIKNEFPGINIIVVNKIFTSSCGVGLEINFEQPLFLVIYDMKGTPKKELCRDYMLMLAANDITVRRINSKMVADLIAPLTN